MHTWTVVCCTPWLWLGLEGSGHKQAPEAAERLQLLSACRLQTLDWLFSHVHEAGMVRHSVNERDTQTHRQLA